MFVVVELKKVMYFEYVNVICLWEFFFYINWKLVI